MEKLGEGGNGKVYRGNWMEKTLPWRGSMTPWHRRLLIKCSERLISFRKKQLMTSWHFWHVEFRFVRHKRIVQPLGMTMDPIEKKLIVVMELMKNGSLYDLLIEEKQKLTLPLLIRLALDIAKGIDDLHSCNPKIIHRDLKSANIMVSNAAINI